MTEKGKRRGLIALGVVCLAVIALIWGKSLLAGETSGAISDGFTAFLAKLFGGDPAAMAHMVRKLAHFCEFALLGMLSCLLLRLLGKRKWTLVQLLALCMMAFPIVDETIQLFTPQRGPSVADIWIDMSGYALGAALTWIIHAVVIAVKARKKHT